MTRSFYVRTKGLFAFLTLFVSAAIVACSSSGSDDDDGQGAAGGVLGSSGAGGSAAGGTSSGAGGSGGGVSSGNGGMGGVPNGSSGSGGGGPSSGNGGGGSGGAGNAGNSGGGNAGSAGANGGGGSAGNGGTPGVSDCIEACATFTTTGCNTQAANFCNSAQQNCQERYDSFPTCRLQLEAMDACAAAQPASSYVCPLGTLSDPVRPYRTSQDVCVTQAQALTNCLNP